MKQEAMHAVPQEPNERISNPDKFTLNDLYLAGIYWPLLMDVTKRNQNREVQDFTLIQYADLVGAAKRSHPDDPVVGNAINVSIGKKLDPINWFCREHGLPNLTCLAVDASGKPGLGYMRNNNWELEKAEVASHNWSECDLQFVSHLQTRREARRTSDAAKLAARRRKGNEQQARDALFAWWKPLKDVYPDITYEQRERMVDLIRHHLTVEEAVTTVLTSQ